MDEAIEVEGLVRRFGSTVAVDGADLSVGRGQVVGLLGPNGAGKTTIIRVLATLLRPDAGRVRVAGVDVAVDPAGVRRRIALAGQHTSVDDELTGRANLVLLARLLDLPRRAAVARAAALLARFGLDEAADRPVGGWSGGMRRRLDLAAAMIGRPEVVFLDEPSVGLDPGRREQWWATVRELREEGVTVLLTTQYLEEADALADRIVVVDRGRVIAAGSCTELKRRVGGHTVVLRPAGADLAVASETVVRVVGEAPRPGRQGELIAPLSDPAVFAALVAELARRGVVVGEIALRLPDLDEVFRALTTPDATADAA